VIEIHRLAFGLFAIRVDQDDFGGHAAQQQAESETRPNVSKANDRYAQRGVCGQRDIHATRLASQGIALPQKQCLQRREFSGGLTFFPQRAYCTVT
jgi:hypothetical protein